MDNQNPKQDESTSQFETPLRELQAIRKEQTDFMWVQSLKNDELSAHLARLEVHDPEDCDKRREWNGSHLGIIRMKETIMIVMRVALDITETKERWQSSLVFRW